VFEPTYAGVGFSLNPSNPDQIIMNFSEGLGEFVVASHGQPATIIYDRNTKEFSS
jgi:phosphoenolpyruvate synthase/pyruvate phosphate dikinase